MQIIYIYANVHDKTKTSHPEYILISLLLVCSFFFFFSYLIFGQVPQLNFIEVKCVVIKI